MKHLLLFFFLLFGLNIQGQVKPTLFPEDVLVDDDLKARCFCSPGVVNKSKSRGLVLSYGWMQGGTFNEQDNVFSNDLSKYKKLEHLTFKIKVPFILKDNFKLLVGYKHFSEYFNFNNIGNDFDFAFNELNDQTLKSNSLSIIVSKPIDETRYMAFRLRYTSNGDYSNPYSFRKRYAIYKFMGLYAFKPNENLEWGIGIGASKSFRRNNILPFILFNKNFNAKWGIEAVFPGLIFGRYNIDQENYLLFGVEYDSESYRIDINEDNNPTPFAFAYNHSEVIASLRFEHQFAPWVWGNIKTGYQFNFSSEFESKNDLSIDFNANPTGSPFFNIGIFISPPTK